MFNCAHGLASHWVEGRQAQCFAVKMLQRGTPHSRPDCKGDVE